MAQPDWEYLTDLFVQGDNGPELWDPIIKDLKALVGSLIYRVNHDPRDVDDLVHNTVEAMCVIRLNGLFDAKLANIRTRAHFLARHQVAQFLRKRRSEILPTFEDPTVAGEGVQNVGVEEQVLEWISSAERATWLREQLLSMPAPWREAFVFRLNLEWLIVDPPVPAPEDWLQAVSRQPWRLGASQLGKSERALARDFHRAVRRLQGLQLAESQGAEV